MKLETCKTCASHSFTYTPKGKKCNYCGNEYTTENILLPLYEIRNISLWVYDKFSNCITSGNIDLKNSNNFISGSHLGNGVWHFLSVETGEYDLCKDNEFIQKINL